MFNYTLESIVRVTVYPVYPNNQVNAEFSDYSEFWALETKHSVDVTFNIGGAAHDPYIEIEACNDTTAKAYLKDLQALFNLYGINTK